MCPFLTRSRPARPWKSLVVAAGLAAFSAGCQTPRGALSEALAYVTIEHHSVAEIEAAARTVFQKEGFVERAKVGNELRFEKRANKMSDLAYGGWYDSAVRLRVVVRTRPLNPETFVLDCDAYRVRNAENEFVEDAAKLSRSHHSKYRKLLEQVKAALPQAEGTDAAR